LYVFKQKFTNVTANHTISVTFKLLPPDQHTVTVSASPTEGGNPTVEGGNVHTHGSNVTVHANKNEGYTFVKWTRGGVQQSTEEDYTFQILENTTLVANYKKKTTLLRLPQENMER